MWWNATALNQPAAHTLASSGAWGEGLVDQGLTTLWYPAAWDTVSDDELVFLLPVLSRWRPGGGDDGPVGYLSRVLTTRALSAVALIGQRTKSSATAALDLLVTSGTLTRLPAEGFELPEGACGTEWAGRITVLEGPEGNDRGLPDWLIVELTAIAYLDRMLCDAHPAGRSGRSDPIVDWPLSLSDVVAATINARINGAYVYPEFAFAHELLAAAAVLGHLVQGRAAFIPPALAGCLVELFSADASASDDLSASVLRTYADSIGGSKFILALARQACARGEPCLARPRAAVASKDAGSPAWNSRLLQRIRNTQKAA